MNNDKWKAVNSINTALHLSLFIFFIIYTYVVYS